MSAVLKMPVGRDPVWVSEHEYLVRWKGRLVRCDVRKQKPLPMMSDECLRVSAVNVSDYFKRALTRRPKRQRRPRA